LPYDDFYGYLPKITFHKKSNQNNAKSDAFIANLRVMRVGKDRSDGLNFSLVYATTVV
jgi:hypothetical protein